MLKTCLNIITEKGNEAVKVDTHVFDAFSMSCSGFSTIGEIKHKFFIDFFLYIITHDARHRWFTLYCF